VRHSTVQTGAVFRTEGKSALDAQSTADMFPPGPAASRAAGNAPTVWTWRPTVTRGTSMVSPISLA